MAITLSNRPIAAARLETLARRLLDASTLCAIATVSPGNRPHVNTAYFAWSVDLELVWLSEPGARHSRNLRRNATASIAVYDSNQRWGNPDRGVQLFGAAREVAGPAARDAEHTYAARFPWYERAEVGAYRFYRFRPRRVKLLDEEALGAGVFVTASVHAGQIAWQQTEIYDRGS
jgi:uncharacterized protein YhbP (UPF0306 family)